MGDKYTVELTRTEMEFIATALDDMADTAEDGQTAFYDLTAEESDEEIAAKAAASALHTLATRFHLLLHNEGPHASETNR